MKDERRQGELERTQSSAGWEQITCREESRSGAVQQRREIKTHASKQTAAEALTCQGLCGAACQRSLAIVQAFWYNGEKEDRREEEWNSGNRITGETW